MHWYICENSMTPHPQIRSYHGIISFQIEKCIQIYPVFDDDNALYFTKPSITHTRTKSHIQFDPGWRPTLHELCQPHQLNHRQISYKYSEIAISFITVWYTPSKSQIYFIVVHYFWIMNLAFGTERFEKTELIHSLCVAQLRSQARRSRRLSLLIHRFLCTFCSLRSIFLSFVLPFSQHIHMQRT